MYLKIKLINLYINIIADKNYKITSQLLRNYNENRYLLRIGNVKSTMILKWIFILKIKLYSFCNQ